MENINGLQKFIDICMKTLVKVVSRKKKYSRASNMPFINKSPSRTHMERN